MSVDPFKSTSYQVGRILNAFTSDANGNLILADVPNGAGVTLSQILAGLVSSVNTNLNGSVYYKDILSTDFSATSYSFGNEPLSLGFEYVIEHNFQLLHKQAFTVNIIETASGRKIQPQEVVAIDTNTIRLIMTDTTGVSVTVVGFQS